MLTLYCIGVAVLTLAAGLATLRSFYGRPLLPFRRGWLHPVEWVFWWLGGTVMFFVWLLSGV